MIQQILLGSRPSAPAGLSALLHFDGESGGTTFTDETGKVWTNAGYVSIDTSVKKFGTGSGSFPAASSTYQYITTLSHSDFAFGAGDFTVEAQMDFASGTGYYGSIICCDNIGGTRGWLLYKDSSTDNVNFAIFVGATAYSVADPNVVTLGTFDHYAACRDGGTLRLYRNGVQVASTSITGTANAPAVPCVIGALWSGGAPSSAHRLRGNLDEVRVIKGTCMYPGGTTFTPPAAAFPPP